MPEQDQPTGEDSTVPWSSLERRRSTAFLAAAGLLIGFVASNAVDAFTAAQPPVWVNALFVAPAVMAASTGLLGFYPRCAERNPRLALVSAVMVAIAGIGAVSLLFVTTGNALAGTQLPFLPVYFLTLLGTILGFILTSVTSLRAGASSRRVGLLLLGPPTVNLIMLATAPMNPPQWSSFLISALWTVSIASIGVALRNVDIRSEHADQSTDTVA